MAEFVIYGENHVKSWGGAGALLLDFIRTGEKSGKLTDWMKALGKDADTLLNIQNGTWSNDYLRGGEGISIISGGQGNDYVYGNGGNDILDGGFGNDYLEGGAGSDTYISEENSAKTPYLTTTQAKAAKTPSALPTAGNKATSTSPAAATI